MSEQAREPPVGVVLGADNTPTLPDAIARQFQPADRFVLVQQDHTLILKRLDVLRVSDIVAAAPDEPGDQCYCP